MTTTLNDYAVVARLDLLIENEAILDMIADVEQRVGITPQSEDARQRVRQVRVVLLQQLRALFGGAAHAWPVDASPTLH